MKAKVQKTIELPDGGHEGVIKELVHKTEPHDYCDIIITENETKFDLKCGVPLYISKQSALGIILENFGAKLKVDVDVKVEDFLKIGQKVKFTTIKEEGKGTRKGQFFTNIQPTTLKPIEGD